MSGDLGAMSGPDSVEGPAVGDDWPDDKVHDAARGVIRGAKDLSPPARKAVADAMDKASAPPTGRGAQDGALGRALGSGTRLAGL
jgi:hypothetical protein